MQIGHGRGRRRAAGGAAVLAFTVMTSVTACGSSTHVTTTTTKTPSPTLAESPTPSTSSTPTPTPTSTNTATATVSTGPKSASCVNGWVQPQVGSDFYKQATQALEQSQGGSGYVVQSVRYFAGPLSSGGIGAVYYLDVRDPRLTARVLLVSGAGPASVAIARSGSTGWKAGDWFGFRGTAAAAVTPLPGIAHPGKWAGPEYDPVGGASPLLSPSLSGCLEGT